MSEQPRQPRRTDREMPARLTPAQPIPDARGEEVVQAAATGESPSPTAKERQRALTARFMERVCEPANLNRAYARVTANKGSPGVDGMTVGQLGGWIKRHRQEFIASLLDGSYRPQPGRGVQIPKPGGKGMRQLGIPTVVDRLVQQAMLQVLEPILDPTFSASSYGFRPGRGAHDALAQARRHVADGRAVVVDIDLEKF